MTSSPDSPDSAPPPSGQRKYLAVADGTPESRLALRFAALAAKRSQREMLILMVGEPAEGFQQWLGVEELLRAETREEAQELLGKLASEISSYAGFTPQTLFREGDAVEEVQTLLQEDPHIIALVLASSPEGGAEPLISVFASGASGFAIPVIVIPGDLPEREIQALA